MEAMIMPGVQYPHCRPCCSWKASASDANAVLRDAPDGRDLMPISLHREDRARLDRLAVHEHRAGPAVGRVAPSMHAPDQVLPEMVQQQQPRLDLAHVGAPVYRHLDPRNPLSFPRKSNSAPVRLARNSRSTGSPPAAVNDLHPPRFPLISGGLAPFTPFCSKVWAV